MKKSLNIAIGLENKILDKLTVLKNQYPEEMHWALMRASQEKLVELLNMAWLQPESFPEYPEIETSSIILPNERWQNVCTKINSYNTTGLLETMSISNLHEKMSEFYSQSSSNIAHPLSKIFMQSMVELKTMQSMKVGMLASSYQNKLWEELGYAPFKG